MDIALRGVLCSNDDADIWRWFGWRDIVSPMDIAAALEKANGEEVTVLVNSPGGDVTVGGEIFSMFRRYAGGTEALIQGFAASAATIAIAGCKTIRSEPGAILCYHNPSCVAEGDYRGLEAAAEGLRNVRESIINVYMLRGKKSREEIGALMDKDIWIAPQQAIEYGLIDEIVGLDAEGEPLPTGFAAAVGAYPRLTLAMRKKYHDTKAAEQAAATEKANRARALLRALAKF